MTSQLERRLVERCCMIEQTQQKQKQKQREKQNQKAETKAKVNQTRKQMYTTNTTCATQAAATTLRLL